MTREQIEALKQVPGPVWGSADGLAVRWITSPATADKITAAMRALPQLADEVTRVRALRPRIVEALHIADRGLPLGRNTVELLRELAALIG